MPPALLHEMRFCCAMVQTSPATGVTTVITGGAGDFGVLVLPGVTVPVVGGIVVWPGVSVGDSAVTLGLVELCILGAMLVGDELPP